MDIKELQISVLSRINFCFYDLKNNPQVERIDPITDANSLKKTMENYYELGSIEKNRYVYETVAYLRYSTSVESRIMLIINYLVALLGKGPSNKISIHHNFQDKKDLINLFEKENKDTIRKLKDARNTVYAHMDLRQPDSKECITFEEFERCISFLNGLFDYHFDAIKNVLDVINSK